MKYNYIKGGLNNKLLLKLHKNFIISKDLKHNTLKTIFFKKHRDWVFFESPIINYNKIIYYSSNSFKYNLNFKFNLLKSIDTVYNSTSVNINLRAYLKKFGVIYNNIFYSLKYTRQLTLNYYNNITVINNFFIAVNSVVYSEGSFCYIPKNIF